MIKRRYPDAEIQTRSIEGMKNRRRIWVRMRATLPDGDITTVMLNSNETDSDA